MIIARLGDGRNLVGKGKVLIEDGARLQAQCAVLSEEL